MSNTRSLPLLPPGPPGPALVKFMGRLVDWSVVCIGALMAALVFVNVALHVIGKDLAWVTEFGELLMVWVTFLGGAAAAQRGAHMTITEFVDKLTPAARRWADAAIQSLCVAILGLLTIYGVRLVNANWGNQLTVLEWPMAIQYMGMAIGVGFMLFFVSFDLLCILRGVPREERYASVDEFGGEQPTVLPGSR